MLLEKKVLPNMIEEKLKRKEGKQKSIMARIQK